MSVAEPDGSQTNKVSEVIEHLFRHESAKMVATLTRIFGVENLQLAEDVVQEALARAMQTWPFYGVPENPAGWIMRASRNLALDVVRREKVFQDKQAQLIHLIDQPPSLGAETFNRQEIPDDHLRMMFVCCHPLVSNEDQVALALKTLCGFSPPEIAKAFLSTEVAIAKRLTRAKQKLREAKIRFEIPEGPELVQRLDGVLHTLYLMFNEGYKASTGDKLVREDVCFEAIRLTALLLQHPASNRPRVHALLALMLLNAARLSTRVDGDGNLLLLQEQNRSHWDQALIARGLFHMAQSATEQEISSYHLQAGIAACHCMAKDYASTNWRQIIDHYDRLMMLDGTAVIALNRAVAVAELHGAQAGIESVKSIKGQATLESYHLFHAVLGEFEYRVGNQATAAKHFARAVALAETTSEREFLARRQAACAIPG